MLARRPDLIEVEQNLVAENALVGVALSEFFPRIGLTAFAGSASSELSDLLTSGTGLWSLVGTAAGRAFTFGRPVVLDETVWTPSLRLGRTVVDGVNAYIGDFHIFDMWRLQDEPTLLIGMDVLARSQEMAIDYEQGIVYFRKRPRAK